MNNLSRFDPACPVYRNCNFTSSIYVRFLRERLKTLFVTAGANEWTKRDKESASCTKETVNAPFESRECALQT